MSDKLPIIQNEVTPAITAPPVVTEMLRGGSAFSSINSSANPAQYEELLGGVPCPSCNGSGRIPKELEKQLVALIPFTDNRLKPRRTLLWVLLAVVVCLIVCGILLFFLVPRSVTLSQNESPITEIFVVSYEPNEKLIVNFLNYILASNDNFFNVRMVNATSSVVKVVFPDSHEVIGKGFNNTKLTIPLKTTNMPIWLNHTVSITDWAFRMCETYYGYVRLYFQYTVTFEYFSHQEQETCETSQLVCCRPTANCTQLTSGSVSAVGPVKKKKKFV